MCGNILTETKEKNIKIGFLGGDMRTIELYKICKENYKFVCTYGLEKCIEIEIKDKINNFLDFVSVVDIVITAIPLSKDGKNINTIFSEQELNIDNLIHCCKNKIVITGNISDDLKNKLQEKNEVYDILKLEELAVLNSIPTAEGAIQIAMEKSTRTIHGSKCLILGFGRIGKILSKMLFGIGAEVFCEARKESDIAWIKSYGYNSLKLEMLDSMLSNFDFIFNTIPYVILNKANLKNVNKECLIIDLASKPGGIDFEEAKNLELNVEWALALPGKVAPKTSAMYIFDIINGILN